MWTLKLLLLTFVSISAKIAFENKTLATLPQWQELECEVIDEIYEKLNLKTFLFSRDTSTSSLRPPSPGLRPRMSVSCTEAGWWTSEVRGRQTVSWDMAWVWECAAFIGLMVKCYEMHSIFRCYHQCSGNDITNSGVWTHARDDSEVTWFPRVQTCSGSHEQYSDGGDAFQIYIGCPRIFNGAYCDRDHTYTYESSTFICEGII